MKKYVKKAAGMWLVSLCMAVVLILGTTAVSAEEAADTTQQLVLLGEGYTLSLLEKTDEELDAMAANSDDSFTLQAVEAWQTSKDELGALVEDAETGEVTVVQKGTEYTVSVPKVFEKANVNFVYVFDRRMNPESITLDVKLPLGTTLVRAALNTLVGILTVFLVLIFLSFVISLLQYIPGLVGGIGASKKPASAPAPVKAAPAPVSAAPAPAEELVDDGELVAVIAAAIAAAEGAVSTDGFVVRSIRKVNRRR